MNHTFFIFFTQCLIPVCGLYIGIKNISKIIALRLVLKKLFFTAPLIFTAGIPTVGAALYFHFQQSRMGKIVACLIPLSCMFIFMTDAIGSNAWYYSLYWLVPVCITLRNSRNFFLDALGSTFTAHALGSLFWLKAGMLTAAQWNALIPMVCIERLICALGMTILFTLSESIRTLVIAKQQSSLI